MAHFSDTLPAFLPFSQRANLELNIVNIDHNYSKPWSAHPDASNARPMRRLFMEPFPRPNSTEIAKTESDIISVDEEDTSTMPGYDVARAKTLMSDCERNTALLHPEFLEMKDDWEDHIAVIRTTWSVLQNRIFAKVMRVLQADRLARLTIQEIQNETIQRRLQIDKAAKRVRYAYANVNWDIPLILWLHNLFLEKLRGQLLVSYLEVLQTLKEKIPSLVECLIEGTVCKPGGLTVDSLGILLKRTWDPVLSSIHQQKPKKLPGTPLILMVSNVPSATNPMATKRYKFWQHQLSCMGKVVNIIPVNNSPTITVSNCVENMIASTRSKILEMKGHFPGRVIVLVGFHVGALVATQVALMEAVNAVVCIGYPTISINGNRGDIDEPVYNTKTPTLFVVGQHASSCHLDTLEDIREKVRVETSLVVVGGADDQLRMSRAKKKSSGVTQSLVDRCIIDEMTEFLGGTLSQAINQPEQTTEEIDVKKKLPRKRKLKEMAVAVGSQTPELVKKEFLRAMKSLKQDPLLSSAMATASGNPSCGTPQGTISGASEPKSGKHASPKKQSKGSGKPSSRKRQLLQVPQSSKARRAMPSLSNIKEAAAIASAPELSNLLQNMNPVTPTNFLNPKMSSSSSVLSPTPSVSTLSLTDLESSQPLVSSSSQSISKLVTSSASLKSEEDPLLSQSLVSNRKADDDSSSKNLLLTKQLLPGTESSVDSTKQTTQILIHPTSSSHSQQPISIPLSFTMANKMLKTMSNAAQASISSSEHSQTSPACGGAIDTMKSSKLHSSLVSKTPIVVSCVPSQSSSKSTSTLSMKPVRISESQSPIASVISMGSDTVQMKETPPSITSAPGTVSIDLGQLATSNSIVMKFGVSSKISLMPTLKPVYSTSPVQLTKSVPSSYSSTSISLDSSASSTKASPTCISVISKTPSSTLSSSARAQIVSLASKSVSTPKEVAPLKSSSGKSLTLLSGSQLKSTSSPNFITLKLASPTSSSASNADSETGKTISSLANEVARTDSSPSQILLQSINVASPFKLQQLQQLFPQKKLIEISDSNAKTLQTPQKKFIEISDSNAKTVHTPQKKIIEISDSKTPDTRTPPSSLSQKKRIEISDSNAKTLHTPQKKIIEISDSNAKTVHTPQKKIIEISDYNAKTLHTPQKKLIEISDSKTPDTRTPPSSLSQKKLIEISDSNKTTPSQPPSSLPQKKIIEISDSNKTTLIQPSSLPQKKLFEISDCNKSPHSPTLASMTSPAMTVSSVTTVSPGTPLSLNTRPYNTSLLSTSPMVTSSRVIIGSGVETLGQVSSLLESSPVTMGSPTKLATSNSPEEDRKWTAQTPPTPPQCSQGGQPGSSTPRASKSSISSYAALAKPVSTPAISTRTRKIKTPRQYDL